jgi:hypothetical protein
MVCSSPFLGLGTALGLELCEVFAGPSDPVLGGPEVGLSIFEVSAGVLDLGGEVGLGAEADEVRATEPVLAGDDEPAVVA